MKKISFAVMLLSAVILFVLCAAALYIAFINPPGIDPNGVFRLLIAGCVASAVFTVSLIFYVIKAKL